MRTSYLHSHVLTSKLITVMNSHGIPTVAVHALYALYATLARKRYERIPRFDHGAFRCRRGCAAKDTHAVVVRLLVVAVGKRGFSVCQRVSVLQNGRTALRVRTRLCFRASKSVRGAVTIRCIVRLQHARASRHKHVRGHMNVAIHFRRRQEHYRIRIQQKLVCIVLAFESNGRARDLM